MKIIVLAKRSPSVSLEQIRPHFQAEVQAVWDLYLEGVIREFYTRADEGGPAILAIESESVDTARKALAKLPLVEMNMLDLEYVPLAPFRSLSHLFEAEKQAAV